MMDNNRPDPTQLVGVREAAGALGVKSNTIHKWRERHPSFPEPLVMLSTGPVWWLPDLDAWDRNAGQ